MKNHQLKKGLIFGVVILLVSSVILPSINGEIGEIHKSSNYFLNSLEDSMVDKGILDGYYIYNITKALSNIIFTEYNESAGELAKGRAFGTKGEWAAAKILFDNMTALGLNTTMERIVNTEAFPKLTHKLEILDYGLKINNEVIHDFHITPSGIGPRDNPEQLDYNFTYDGLKVKPMPEILLPQIRNRFLNGEKEDYVFIHECGFRNPNWTPPLIDQILDNFLFPFSALPWILRTVRSNFKKSFLYKWYPKCRAVIIYDFNDNCHDLFPSGRNLPMILINGTLGKKIMNNIKETTVDFYINQSYNDSVESYNVIGQLDGTDPSKTVIVDCLYDSWWCQGTADAAIGMAMVLGVAKYFVDNDIRPKYNLKFIGFGGEEYGMRGAISYEYIHKTENVIYVIDLNQICFTQEEPRLTLNIICNKLGFLNKIWKVVKRTNYVERTGDVTDIKPWWMLKGAPSDDEVFAMFRPFRCRTVSVLKGPPWLLHHRDGLNHTEGDVLKYFNWTDLNVTGEIVWNITEYLTVDLPGDYTSYYTDDSAINVVDFMKEKSRF